jgi:hypothetical protein
MDAIFMRTLYSSLLLRMNELGFISLRRISLRTEDGWTAQDLATENAELVHLYEAPARYTGGKNWLDLFVLPNGVLYMSNGLYEEIIRQENAMEKMTFLLLRTIAHVIILDHAAQNIKAANGFGDLKHQLF